MGWHLPLPDHRVFSAPAGRVTSQKATRKEKCCETSPTVFPGPNLPVLSGQILLSQTWLLGEYEIKQVEEESFGYRLSYLVTSSPLVAVVCSTPPRKGILECSLAPPKGTCVGGSPALGIVKRKPRSNGAPIFSWMQEVQMVGINLP